MARWLGRRVPWVLALAILFVLRGQLVDGLVGLGLAGPGLWRCGLFQTVALPGYALLAAPVRALRRDGRRGALGNLELRHRVGDDLSWWQLLPLLAVLSPFATIGGRRGRR